MAGFPKSGTSSLHSALVLNSEIYDGGKKEPKTYSYDNRYRNRNAFFKRFYQSFQGKYILDSSTTYMACPKAKERILKDSPDAKFIVVARDPVDRIVSHYNWLSSHNFINKPPAEELRNHLNEKYNYRNHYRGKYKAYIDFSRYGEQMNTLIQLMPRENILFIKYEDLFKGFTGFKDVFEGFLGIDFLDFSEQKVNRTVFKENDKSNKTFFQRIPGRLRYESRVLLERNPRGLKVSNPKEFKVKRHEIEELVLPVLRDDILLLNELGFPIDSWQSFQACLKIS